VILTRAEATLKIREYANPRISRASAHLISQYAQIILLVFVAVKAFESLPRIGPALCLVIFCIMMLIGARQYAVLVLLHDAQHNLLSKNKKLNDFFAKYLIAGPLLSFFDKSRSSHLDHHQHLGDPIQDPDYDSYCGGNPRKIPFRNLIKYLLIEMTGNKLLQILKGKKKPQGRSLKITGGLGDLLRILGAQALVLLIFKFVFGSFFYYFIFWVLPIVTIALLLNQIRLFAEHSIPELQARKFSSDEILFTFESNSLERFLISPNNMNYHAEHHLFPIVPFYNLPKVREVILKCPELCAKFRTEKSYTNHITNYFINAKRKFAS
jgi:fatty acid desaturase